MPGKTRKHKRLGDSESSCIRRRAEHINHVWTYDFVADQTEDGRRLKMLVVLDEYTRETLTIEVARSIKAPDVIATLEYLFAVRGAPEYLRSDNGPEFVAEAVRQWLKNSGVHTLYIAPGSPWENAVFFQMAEVAVPRNLFAAILDRIQRLRAVPGVAPS